MTANIFLNLDPFITETFKMRDFYFYIPMFIAISLISSSFWVSSPTSHKIYAKLSSALIPGWMETTSRSLKGFPHILMASFVLIFTLNFMSLFPYVFAYSAHLSFSITLALPLWLSLLSAGWMKNTPAMGASLVPYGAPMALTPFLCVLETISFMIRPVSLSLRLAVNISAGHCFLSFISQFLVAMFFSFPLAMVPMFVVHLGYFLFEIGISFIQAYIFTTLLALYSNDHPH